MKPRNLAELFGLDPPAEGEPPLEQRNMTAKEFCDAVVNSYDFRKYIVDGIRAHILPPQILGRIIDQAWGKAPDRVEHTGRDGNPIVTEIRRVIVQADECEDEGENDVPLVTH